MKENTYKTAIDNINFNEKLMDNVLNSLTNREIKGKKNIRKPAIILPSVACILMLIIGMQVFTGGQYIKLTNSIGNVSVKYIAKAPLIDRSYELVWLSEEEIFNRFNTAIFKGTVLEIKNIKIQVDGYTDYLAIAEIKVDKIYRGIAEEKIGKSVTVLLPCPIDSNIWIEDTEIISGLRVGTIGIFMPIKYNEESYIGYNNAKLFLMDIAEYGFADGMRYAFLQKPGRIDFYRDAFPSISKANTIEEIEEYILQMIK